ncbi:MAG: hypothetical protein EOM16_04650 [Bacteroidia bacterium]|nr:hypothetical protein [Bacteroidia bacterium]
MMKVKFTTALVILIISNIAGYGQVKYPSATFDGTIKTKYEYATETNMSRFSVRNSRLGLSGNITEPLTYRVQVELSSSGDFQVLDLSATLNPFKNFHLTFGQTSIPIYNSYVVSPPDLLFANRAFLGKYFTGTRDIGAVAKYLMETSFMPLTFEFGVFNGNTINDPVWTSNLAYAARVQMGSMDGLRVTAKIYDYPMSATNDYFIWGADFRYAKGRYLIESEVMDRYNRFDETDRLSLYIQGAYSFPLDNPGVIHDITPLARWDAIGENISENNFDATRMTLGVNLGLDTKMFASSLRFNYEYYFVERALPEFNRYEEMDSNKFTIELLLLF